MFFLQDIFFFQDAPPNTDAYTIAGYAVIFGVILLYLVSLYLRNRNLKQDMDLFQELNEKD